MYFDKCFIKLLRLGNPRRAMVSKVLRHGYCFKRSSSYSYFQFVDHSMVTKDTSAHFRPISLYLKYLHLQLARSFTWPQVRLFPEIHSLLQKKSNQIFFKIVSFARRNFKNGQLLLRFRFLERPKVGLEASFSFHQPVIFATVKNSRLDPGVVVERSNESTILK